MREGVGGAARRDSTTGRPAAEWRSLRADSDDGAADTVEQVESEASVSGSDTSQPSCGPETDAALWMLLTAGVTTGGERAAGANDATGCDGLNASLAGRSGTDSAPPEPRPRCAKASAADDDGVADAPGRAVAAAYDTRNAINQKRVKLLFLARDTGTPTIDFERENNRHARDK